MYPTSFLLSLIKLLPYVNRSSSAFGRGFLPRSGQLDSMESMISIQSCSRGPHFCGQQDLVCDRFLW